MSNLLSRTILFFGLYRAAEVVYSIWAGKSLLWIAVGAAMPTIIAATSEGFDWAHIHYYALIFAATYASLAVAWLATIVTYRRISPKNKLVVTGFSFNCNPNPSTTPHSNPQAANSFQAVIHLRNIADFPISYVAQDREIEFRMQNTVGNNVFANRGSVVDAQQETSFQSDVVIFHHPINLPVDGVLTATIRYGFPGKEKFERPIRIRVTYSVDPNTQSGVRFDWRSLDV